MSGKLVKRKRDELRELNERLHIVESFPRDGLQMLTTDGEWRLPQTAEKVRLIEALVDTGIREIEVAGFVHPKVIPALADAEQVVEALGRKEGVTYRVLVPNLKGAQRALAVEAQKLGCLISASETYSQLNSNMSVEENINQIQQIVDLCHPRGVPVEVGLGGSFVCPYEGWMKEDHILSMISRFVSMGVSGVSIADSIGMADPLAVTKRVQAMRAEWPDLRFALHLHELSGMGMANVYAAWQAGAQTFETSILGLGWGIAAPISIGDSGNLATEDVVRMFHQMGVETGIDFERLLEVVHLAEKILGAPGRSRAARIGTLDDLIAIGRAQLQKDLPAPGDSDRTLGSWG